MPLYPLPKDNPACKCETAAQAFLCSVGHLTECHYPYDCRTAACSHMARSDYSAEEVAQFERRACLAIRAGNQPPYTFDATGRVIIGRDGAPLDAPADDDEPTVTQ